MAEAEEIRPGEEEEEEEEGDELPVLQKRTDLVYCCVCSIPLEYCEFNQPHVYADCLAWRAKAHPELMPEGASLEELLAGLKIKGGRTAGSGAAGQDDGAKAADEEEDGGGGDDEDAEGEGKKKKKKSSSSSSGPKASKKKSEGGGGKVIITRMSRNKRKSVTVVTGLDAYPELKLKDAAKAMGKLFACGASVSDTASGGKEIVIQGDVLDPLAAMLEDKFQVPAENIVLKP